MDNAPIHECNCNQLPISQSELSEVYITLSEAIDTILRFHHFKYDRHHIRVYKNADYSKELRLFHTASNSCSRIIFSGQMALSVFNKFLYGSFNNLLQLDPDLCGDYEPLHEFN